MRGIFVLSVASIKNMSMVAWTAVVVIIRIMINAIIVEIKVPLNLQNTIISIMLGSVSAFNKI
jgi:hypothetical protein